MPAATPAFEPPTRSCEAFGYRADDHWAQVPPEWTWHEATAVAVDSRDRVFVFNRGPRPVLIFDCSGEYLDGWGEGVFTRPHGVTLGPDDHVYCVDDMGHAVRKFTADGRLLLTLGVPGKPSDTGATSLDFREIKRSGSPFHYPTNIAITPDGEMYVADGYGNARVHRFSPTGELLDSWGEPGDGPGEFKIPHGIALDRRGRVYVADRENSRIQIFDAKGQYLDSWTDIARPCQIFIDDHDIAYIAEVGFRAGMWPGIDAPSPDATGGRLGIYALTGERLAAWGGGSNPLDPGDFYAPHDICLDSRGDIYVAEVTMSAGGNRGLAPAGASSLRKFSKSP